MDVADCIRDYVGKSIGNSNESSNSNMHKVQLRLLHSICRGIFRAVMIVRALILLALIFSASNVSAENAPVRVGMPLPGQVPFFWRDDNGHYTGIYADTLRVIADEIGIELEFVPLSQARLVRHFGLGEIDLEAGVSRDQQLGDSLQHLSLFSLSFGIANEVIIYNPELSFPVFILKDLSGKRVATVRGSTVPEYIDRENFASERQIALRVHRGWNDIGLMKEAQAIHYQRSLDLNYQISLPYQSNPVAFRLHVQRAELLQPMNRAIEKLDQQGLLKDIVCRYLCGTD